MDYTFLSYLRLKVGVEDGQSEMGIPVSVDVSTNMTIAELKDKVTPSWHGNKQFMWSLARQITLSVSSI